LAIDTDNYNKRREVKVVAAPAGLIVSPNSEILYVAARDTNDIAVIDTATLTITKRIKVGKHPFGLSLSANGDALYSVNVYDNTVSIINTATYKQAVVKVGEHPYCAVTSPDNKTLYVTNTQDDTITIIKLDHENNQHKIVATVDVGMTPEGISYDAASDRVLVANWGDNNVSVIDAMTNKRIGNIKTGDKSRAFGQFVLNYN